MESEVLTQAYIETTKTTMEAMAAVAADNTRSVDDRLKAAAAVSGMGDTIVKSNILAQGMRENNTTGKKMVRSLDKLIDKHDHKDD